jgi:regulator of replication initiation timing
VNDRAELEARVKELLLERDALRREADLLRERLRRAEAALARQAGERGEEA